MKHKKSQPNNDTSKVADRNPTFPIPTEIKETEGNKVQEQKPNLNNSELVFYYGYQLQHLEYEANGIWSRFNIMIGISASFFVLMSFMYSSGIENKDDLILIVCIGGFLLSIWSLFVLKKLSFSSFITLLMQIRLLRLLLLLQFLYRLQNNIMAIHSKRTVMSYPSVLLQ